MSRLQQSLAGKSAIVTGGARGLGESMSKALALAGASVVIADVNVETDISWYKEFRGKVTIVKADVRSYDDAQMVIGMCIERYGSMDILINNAGILMREVRKRVATEGLVKFWDVDRDTFCWFLDVHVIGSFLMSKAAVHEMRKVGRGRIISVTTSFPTMLGEGRTPYGPAKAAMEALAAVMARDLEGSGITVNVVIPGRTALSESESRRTDASVRRPNGRRLQPRNPPEIMGPPVVWLASDQASHIHGLRITCNKWNPSIDPLEAIKVASTPIGWLEG